MDAQNQPIMLKRFAAKSGHFLKTESGFESLQGRRPYMEDTFVNFDKLPSKNEDIETQLALEKGIPTDMSLQFPNPHISFYGVYDGHSGRIAADLCAAQLHNYIFGENQLCAEGKFKQALISGITNCDKMILQQAQMDNNESEDDQSTSTDSRPKLVRSNKAIKKSKVGGSCCVIATIIGQKLYVANLGDCEVLLARKRENFQESYDPIVLSTLHKVSDPKEKERIEKSGGQLLYGRLYGDVAVSRSFGDLEYKKPKSTEDLISAEPAIKSVRLRSDTDDFLILACDGLWDKLTYQDAVDLAAKWKQEGKSVGEVAKLLADEAIARHSKDNVTVVVVFLHWSESPRALESSNRLGWVCAYQPSARDVQKVFKNKESLSKTTESLESSGCVSPQNDMGFHTWSKGARFSVNLNGKITRTRSSRSTVMELEDWEDEENGWIVPTVFVEGMESEISVSGSSEKQSEESVSRDCV
eukprot:TRINITY_DN10536_c0_g1_i2.p1 TRINITY_DN10536_c0_g1~~TRINITY_DN10536_c0_g1_i2.p1  ORF type:complete len:542 (-),score=74.87 TRINITY_DN10536_c0_g1_i2:84-1496(-)